MIWNGSESSAKQQERDGRRRLSSYDDALNCQEEDGEFILNSNLGDDGDDEMSGALLKLRT